MRPRPGSGSKLPRSRLPGARWALALAGAALLCAAALTGPARPLHAQEPAGTAETDRAALMALYQATGGATWTINTNWGSSAPLGAWHGVTVSAQGRVTHLSLFENDLAGFLPAALGDLGALTYLSLEGNRLRGLIPGALGGLTGLESLALGGNDLSGEIPAALGRLTRLQLLSLADNRLRGPVPTWIGDLTALEYLDLSGNSLSGEVPAALGGLAALRKLDLSGNSLSGEVPAALGDLAALRELDLSGNALSGEIPAALGGLANLEDLRLEGNRLRGPLPEALGGLANLRTMLLQDNRLSGEIPAALGDLANLQLLSLGRNTLRGEIPAALGGLADLTELDLGANSLSGEIPAALGDLADLTALVLGGNELRGPIPAALGALSSLEFIRFAPNGGLSGCIPYGLRALLALSGDVDAPPAHDLPALILPVCLLRDLQIRGAPLDRPFAGGTTPHVAVTTGAASYSATVPGSVTETAVTAALHDARDTVTILKDGYFYASGEPLPLDPGSNRIIIEVVPGDDTIPIRERVIVTVTRGTAEYPVALDPDGEAADRAALLALYAGTDGPNWTAGRNWGSDRPLSAWQGVTTSVNGRVTGLALAHNNLTGTLPASLGDLAGLVDLDLSGNRLRGPLPAALGRARGLRELDLSGNRLSGTLPAAWGDLGALETLDLGGNRLSGPLPAAWGDLAELETLDLGGNRLRGGIPAVLGGLAHLETLDLGGNRFDGPLPAALGGLRDLETLDLHGNRLRGPLPAALGGLRDLETLDLGGNRFDGPLPSWLGGLRDLRTLDLGGNRLSGPLPSWLADLAHLEVLDLGGNRLSGPLPSWLGDLADLRVIRLAGNALHGCIPHGLRDLPAHDLSDLGLPFCLLRDLQVAGAALEPPFSAGEDAYSAAVGRGVTETALTALLHDDGDAVTIRKDGRDYASGDPLPLDLGSNPITVVAVPADGTPAQTVTVTVTRLTTDSIMLHLRQGSDMVAVPAGTATTAAALFGGAEVSSVWKYNRATRAWDLSYRPGRGGFPIAGGDVLWVVAPVEQTLIAAGTPPLDAAAAAPITLHLRQGGDMVAVPAGTATTAAALFGSAEVSSVWKYNRATRAWDLSYRPGRGGFPIAGGDVLWVVAPRAQTVGG